jgi:acetyltransferase-like isoleucine patch superfamily enzyme
MVKQNEDILVRLNSGEKISLNDPQYFKVQEIIDRTIRLSVQLNAAGSIVEARNLLGDIIGTAVSDTSIVVAPFYTNFGKFISIGKNVFINHACSFLDMGGITIEDGALIGPRVNLVTENHPLNPDQRSDLLTKPIRIRQKAWIGAGATILPGVTVGENAVVAAGAVVTKDVPDNTIVGGIPAKIIRSISPENEETK